MLFALMLLAQTAPTAVPDPLMSFLPSLGPTAGVIVLAILFLRYLTVRDAAQLASNEGVIKRVEAMLEEERNDRTIMRTDFLTELRDSRKANKDVSDSMLEMNRDVIHTVDTLAVGIKDLKQAIEELRVQVARKMDKP